MKVFQYFEKLHSCVNTLDKIIVGHSNLVNGPLNETKYFKSFDNKTLSNSAL
jgi:hypothetical protein